MIGSLSSPRLDRSPRGHRRGHGPATRALRAIFLGTVVPIMILDGTGANAVPARVPAPDTRALAGKYSGDRPRSGEQPVAEHPVVEPPAADDPLTVQVLTFGPGSHPFTRFGHNAIRIVDRGAGTDIVYNFGTFTFDSPRLILDFLKGRLRYWLSRSSMPATVRAYRRENRTIEAQELNLSSAEKRELRARLEVNARPENRDYRYDYFADNCSTRVRDVLDVVLRGRLRASAVGQGSMSLRAHALRMASADLPLYTALLIVLGPRTDRPIDEWAEAFLPEMLQRTLRGALLGDDVAAGGHLVKAEQVLVAAARPPAPREPPNRLPAFLGVGIAVGLVLYLLGRAGARSWPPRFLFGCLVACAGLVLGGIGCFLVGAWALTPHAVVYRNENVLLFAPFAIALTVLGLGTAIGRPGATRKAFQLTAAALGLAVAACALKLFPWSRQDNSGLILMMLPLWAGIAAGTRVLVHKHAGEQVGKPVG